jgi:hypothetical protein
MVEPRKPEEVQEILRGASQEELDEYDRLLSQRYESDPSVTETAEQRANAAAREQRLETLGRKIFGTR